MKLRSTSALSEISSDIPLKEKLEKPEIKIFMEALARIFLKRCCGGYDPSNINPLNQEKANEFARFMVESLEIINRTSANNPQQILTTSFNVKDGIGDYINQVDLNIFLKMIMQYFKNIQLLSISILEKNKFNLAKKLTPEDDFQDSVLIDNDSHLENILPDTKKILLDYGINLEDQHIKMMVNNSNLVINIARYFGHHKELCTLLSQFDTHCLIQSRGEYGPLGSAHIDPQQEKVYLEGCMGVEEAFFGVKFYPELQNLCRENVSNAILLNQIEKKDRILGNKYSAEEYAEKHNFAFGYIQDKRYTILFARLMAAKSAKNRKGLCMIANLAHFDDIENDKEFFNTLKKAGYTKIRMLYGDNTKEINIGSGAESGLELTLVEFKGTSQEDKNRYIAMSEMVAGSGNSSFSEMLSSEKFPFIQPIIHVNSFYKSFIDNIKSFNIPNDELLINYLSLNIDKYLCIDTPVNKQLRKEKIQKMIDIISDETVWNKILSAWKIYCSHLQNERNAYDYFSEILSTFVISDVIKFGDTKEWDKVITLLTDKFLSGASVVHFAIIKESNQFIEYLFKKYPHLIDSTLNSKCIYNNFTPLMMAARLKNYDLVKLFIDKGASIAETDSMGNTILHQAVEKSDLKLLKLILSNNNINKSKVRDDLLNSKNGKGMTPLSIAIHKEDIAAIQLITNLNTVQDMVIYSIETKNLALFKLCYSIIRSDHGSDSIFSLIMSNKNSNFINAYLEIKNEMIDKDLFLNSLPDYIKPFLSNVEDYDLSIQKYILKLCLIFDDIYTSNTTNLNRSNQLIIANPVFICAIRDSLKNSDGFKYKLITDLCLHTINVNKSDPKSLVLQTVLLADILVRHINEYISTTKNTDDANLKTSYFGNCFPVFMRNTEEIDKKSDCEIIIELLRTTFDYKSLIEFFNPHNTNHYILGGDLGGYLRKKLDKEISNFIELGKSFEKQSSSPSNDNVFEKYKRFVSKS